METARFFNDIADAPEGTAAYTVTARDGVSLRVGHAPSVAGDAQRGTVLLFPGRTEFIEKYGRVATDFARDGYETLAIDWRGQGLSDRLLPEIRTGHVNRFRDYQHDVAAMISAAETLDLPRPWYLLAHSMGGAIGLRALIEGLPVAAAAFTGPMWGISIGSFVRPAAWAISWSGARMGLGHVCAPGTKPESYVVSETFEQNLLTRDRDTYEWMRAQARADPMFQLGGPSLQWLHEALNECRALARLPAPDLPAVCIVGTAERIVHLHRIEARMAAWPDGKLVHVEGGQHEVLMDGPVIRDAALSEIRALFDRAPERQSGAAATA